MCQPNCLHYRDCIWEIAGYPGCDINNDKELNLCSVCRAFKHRRQEQILLREADPDNPTTITIYTTKEQ